MMRWNHGLLTLGVVSVLACSGKYEVGGMDGGGSGGSGTAGTPADGGAAPTAGTTGTAGIPPTAGAGPTIPPGECVPLGMPPALTGEFATPDVVWSRVSKLIWGEEMPPPAALPEATTPAWAGQIVTQGFAQAAGSTTGALGARRFVAEWLKLGADPEFSVEWETLLAVDAAALPILLQTPLEGDGRLGVFTEPSWLALHSGISTRGAAVATALLQAPPPPPAGVVNPDRDPNASDREALAIQLANPACAACHHVFDPLGFELGNFDSAGDYRELDHGAPVDVTGTVQLLNGLSFSYDGLADFNAKIVDTCDANLGFADGFVRVALDVNEVPGFHDALVDANRDRIRQAFYRSGRSYPDLVRAYAQSPLGLRP